MKRQLLILRHAKSDWNTNVADFDRPLNKRGKRNARQMGICIQQQRLHPDYIISSPAKRAVQTIKRVVDNSTIDAALIHYVDDIYLADLSTLLASLASVPRQAKLVLLVGHNPGLDELVEYLAGKVNHRTPDGKLMTTAALAHLEMPVNWTTLKPDCGRLIALLRAAQL